MFEVAESDPRERLDKLVVALLSRAGRIESRATVQRWIEGERILINGSPARPSTSVNAGSTIEVRPAPPPPSTSEPDPSIELTVVYEDEHLLVIDKPAGLVVHPARGHESGTLVNALLARAGFDAGNADDRDPNAKARPGIVHRLDKGTSGLLVVAKDALTREGLKSAFAAHDMEREYVALVEGRARDATYDTLHGRHPTDRLRFTSLVKEGRRAITHVRVLEHLAAATLVACRLETGRTHQIRVHLAEQSKTPILGDPLYGRPPKDARLRAIAERMGHQALHARVLGFVHPISRRAMRWESPLPRDFVEALAATRSST